MADIISTAGDCFNRIAKAQGFFNYLSIYQHADNQAKFPNPNQLALGSTVKIPEKVMKVFSLPLDAEKKFKLVRKLTKLTVKICKADTSQLPGIAKATLEIGGKKASGRTGLLVIDDIDASLVAASLMLELTKPPPFSAAPATAKGVADQYPPPIVAGDFDDAKTVWPKKGETLSWNLQVGHLEPHTVIQGVLQRLVNLGFTCPVQIMEDAATGRAIRTYRRFVESKASPADTVAAADIAGHIKARHDD